MEIVPIVPPNEASLGLDFEDLDCIPSGAVDIVDDKELCLSLPASVIEVVGKESKITFFPQCPLKYLVFNLKCMDRFLNINLLCVDDNGDTKYVHLTNKVSFITIDKNKCRIPLLVEEGWQRLCIDLEDVLANAFGCSYESCKQVEVCGSCRLYKMYFECRNYAEIELPMCLRVLCE